ncbi:glutamate--cysteine ligase [Streptomyces sp. NPDC020875]|uniref:glutamate--cysteine ligase 2 n=1 Tax=Streptomyces sp. NPDC020875 TaxID=3154898 RepID=UPI0033C197DC
MVRSVGVEEELLLVDAVSGEPRALATAVLAAAARERSEGEEVFEAELHRQQVEFATSPCTAMGELAEEIRHCRGEAARHAEKLGATVVALGTSPLSVSPSLGFGERHRWLEEHFGLTTQEQLTCGCHVHVAVDSDEEGVAVLDRIRPWLAVLLALSANSPFWQGEDSGYSSYRSRVWGRWPSAGPVEPFGTADRYHAQVADMIGTGTLLDEGMVYFDARLSAAYPTVEIRIADVPLDSATTVLIATLARGLVETAARAWKAGQPPSQHRVELLRLASWRAARSGLEDRLLHPATMRPAPAETVLRALFDHVRDALDDHGDLLRAQETLATVLRTGSGARAQRDLLARSDGDLAAMVAACARRTCPDPNAGT